MVKIQHFLWVESLVEELRSHMPCAVANKQKKELSLSLSLFLSLSLSRSFIKKKKEGCTATHHHGLAQFSSVAQSCPTVCDPWTAARQASLSITNSLSLLKLMSITLVMPSNHLILCCPLFLLPSIFPSIRIFSNELVLYIRWPKYWSFSFNISPSNE